MCPLVRPQPREIAAASVILPARRRVSPTIVLISVVLPVPLRPSSASVCPSARVKEISERTSASP